MGITGLLPFLEKASSACHLRDLRGKCVAIDSYCWLHRGAFGCAERLARGEPTDLHIQYCLKYVQLLLSYQIKPILVFDGRHLPAKAATEAKRRESRANARKRGAELLRLGRIEEARSFLRRCVDITHEMALQLIRECRKRNVDCVVAPYEADAQLAFLNRADIAQYVITEDSDLVLFGCNRILFKLDLTGTARLVEADKLHLAMGCREDRYQFAKFRYMCILSGCDYLDSLPGIGLAKACRFVMKTEDPDVRRALAKIPSYLNMRQLSVSEEYKDEFLKADATFKHMVVYDPVQRQQTRLLDPDDEGTPEQYCCNAGEFLDENTAFNLALGNLDPFSLRQMDDWHPDGVDNVDGTTATGNRRRHPSIWKKNYDVLMAEKQSKASGGTQNASPEKTASLTTFVKRPPPNADFVAQGTKDSICDVLKTYGIQSDGPPLKRICQTQTAKASPMSTVAIEYEDVNALDTMALLEQPTTPKRVRNPFVMMSNGTGPSRESPNALLSPIKITPENRSLLKNLSPVKRIDYSQQRQVAMATTTSVTTNRLSRFKRANTTAVVGGGGGGASCAQKVISRFFCSQATTQGTANVARSPDSPTNCLNTAYESPTAIVKEIKSKRDSKIREATALYLQSPEAQPSNRGERTPEKCWIEQPTARQAVESAIVGRTDSGILTGTDGPSEDEDVAPTSESGSEGLTSSQKENDEGISQEVEKQSLAAKSKPHSVRLALFERPVGKKLEDQNRHAIHSEELAIVLDGSDDDTGVAAACSSHHVAKMDKSKETSEYEVQPLSPRSVSKPSGTVGEKQTKSKTSCRRPGLSANRKQSSKSGSGGTLTQSRLSMFGFQKKPTMQLGNH